MLFFNNSAGVPSNKTFPPNFPAPGPISMIQSAWAMISRLCSITINVLSWSTRSLKKTAVFEYHWDEALYLVHPAQ
jgi:hypothetical protein